MITAVPSRRRRHLLPSNESPASRHNSGAPSNPEWISPTGEGEGEGKGKDKGKRLILRHVLALTSAGVAFVAVRTTAIARKFPKTAADPDRGDARGWTSGEGGSVGPCRYHYPQREEPAKGWTEDVDLYFRRESHEDRDAAFVSCLGELDASEVDVEALVDAARLGLTGAVTVLYQKFGLDPLEVPPPKLEEGERVPEARLFNALQEAILGGYAEMIPMLSGGDYETVVDRYGRTILDYVAKDVLMLDDVEGEGQDDRQQKRRHESREEETRPKFESGWNETGADEYGTVCDIDEIYDDAYVTREVFWKEYYGMGRPFVLRNHVPAEGLNPFAKSHPYWDDPTEEKLRVGSTAYPMLTNQDYCEEDMTATDLERGTKCEGMPDKRMVHAWHPTDEDFDELYAARNGNVFSRPYGWRKISEWFGEVNTDFAEDGMAWQIFLGSDGSGATFHWHKLAINALYVGVKEWVLAPPAYRGFTGMQARDARPLLDEDFIVRCTQYPGDVIFFPNHWGHLTINHGFTIGAAVILKDDYQRYALQDVARGEAREAVALPFGSQVAKAEHASKSTCLTFATLCDSYMSCKGSSIINMLSNHCEDEYYTDEWGIDPPHRSFHATAHSYIEHYGREAYDRAFTFAVVRHPLAKQVSNFFFIAEQCQLQTDSCEERLIPIEVGGVPVASLPDEKKMEIFHEWIAAMYAKYPPGSPGHYLFANKGHGNEEYETFGATQLSWMVDEEGSVAVDSVLKLEDLSGDPSLLSAYIPCLQGAEMEKHNKTPKYPDFTLFAENERTKKIMQEVYAEDFATFGYEL
ncbi:hypothetical protein ACHAWF_013898 [Thalassiosira exigua]